MAPAKVRFWATVAPTVVASKTFHGIPAPHSQEELELTEADVQAMSPKMKGIPFVYNHQLHERIGTVTDSKRGTNGEWQIEYELDTSTTKGEYIADKLKQGLVRGVSLSHRPYIRQPIEVSACWLGRRGMESKSHIGGIYQDKDSGRYTCEKDPEASTTVVQASVGDIDEPEVWIMSAASQAVPEPVVSASVMVPMEQALAHAGDATGFEHAPTHPAAGLPGLGHKAAKANGMPEHVKAMLQAKKAAAPPRSEEAQRADRIHGNADGDDQKDESVSEAAAAASDAAAMDDADDEPDTEKLTALLTSKGGILSAQARQQAAKKLYAQEQDNIKLAVERQELETKLKQAEDQREQLKIANSSLMQEKTKALEQARIEAERKAAEVKAINDQVLHDAAKLIYGPDYRSHPDGRKMLDITEQAAVNAIRASVQVRASAPTPTKPFTLAYTPQMTQGAKVLQAWQQSKRQHGVRWENGKPNLQSASSAASEAAEIQPIQASYNGGHNYDVFQDDGSPIPVPPSPCLSVVRASAGLSEVTRPASLEEQRRIQETTKAYARLQPWAAGEGANFDRTGMAPCTWGAFYETPGGVYTTEGSNKRATHLQRSHAYSRAAVERMKAYKKFKEKTSGDGSVWNGCLIDSRAIQREEEMIHAENMREGY